MADALPAQESQNELPAALPYPVSVSVRNSDLAIDDSGNAPRLDDTRIVAILHRPIPLGTVLFVNIDMRTMNVNARGLIRVVAQRPSADGIGFETLGEFVELGDDAKTKIARLLGGGSLASTMPARNFATDQIGVGPVYNRTVTSRGEYQVATSEHSYFEPAPLRQQATATRSTKFWGSLGVTAYVLAFLGIVAFFPAGRAYELMVWDKFAWVMERMWYWANHVGDVKLYNNT